MRVAAGGTVLRTLLASALFGLVALTSSAPGSAQAPPDPPQRWDGLIERLSTPGQWYPESFVNPQMSRHAVSGDGRYFVFSAEVPNPPYPPMREFFIRDRMTGETNQRGPGSVNAPPVISSDGNHHAVEVCGWVPRPDDQRICEIWATDERTLRIENMSTALDGTLSVDGSSEPMLSRDGRFIVFRTNSPTLLPPGSAPGQIVLRDRDTDQDGVLDEPDASSLRVVSVSSTGETGNLESASPEVSADGRFVAFRSRASNLAAGDTNDAWDVFLHDVQTGETRRLNVGWDDQQATPVVDSPAISMSEDGRFIAFAGDDPYLTNPPLPYGDDNDALDVFVFDRVADTLTRIDVGAGGLLGNGQTHWPTLSADGRYVSMVSNATNVANPGTPGRAHVFVHDRVTLQTTRVSTNPDGTEPDRDSAYSTISADGSVVTFVSQSTNLPTAAPPDTDTLYAAVYFDVTPLTLTIPTRGGEVAATVNAQRYVKWDAWITDWTWLNYGSTGAYGFGSGTATFTANRNYDSTARTTTVVMQSKTISVTQEAGLHISGFSPAEGPSSGGTIVTITGGGFEPDMQVYFDGLPATSVEFIDATQVRAVTPAHPAGDAWVGVMTTDWYSAVTWEPFRFTDITPPEIYPFAGGTQGADGWFTSDVDIYFGFHDPDGPIISADGCFPDRLRTDTAGTTYTCTVTSEGGTSTGSITVKRDTTGPAIEIAGPAQTVYRAGDPAPVADYTCADAMNGVAECTGMLPLGQPVEMTPGYHEFWVYAQDTLGNLTGTLRTYVVTEGGCAPRPEGLVAWFPFETISGGAPEPSYAEPVHGSDGIPVNMQFVAGAAGSFAIAPAGSPSYVGTGANDLFSVAGALTLAAWVKPGAATGNFEVIAGREGEYLLGISPDGTLHWSLSTTDRAWGWNRSSTQLQRGVWAHVALVWDGSQVTIYLNGRTHEGWTTTGTAVDATPDLNEFRLGAREDPAAPSYFSGAIDDVLVANRALSSDELQWIVLASGDGLCGPRPTTVTVTPDPVTVAYGASVHNVFTLKLSSGGAAVAGRRLLFFDPSGLLLAPAETDANGEIRFGGTAWGTSVGTHPGFEARFFGDFYYTASSGSNVLIVERAVPTITWPAPASISHGTPLSAAQLNASASVPGTFTYTPAAGTLLGIGSHTLTVQFDPADSANYASTTATRTLSVVDPTAPMIVPTVDGTPGSNGWYRGDVAISFNVTDPESSITSSSGCAPIVVTADTSGTTYVCSATSAGGSASASVFIKRDATAPTISLIIPAATLYEPGLAIRSNYSCADALSGMATCQGTVPNDTQFDRSPGYHTFTVVATDAAGNEATKDVTYAGGMNLCAPRPAGFVAWWPFEEPFGSTGMISSYRDMFSGILDTGVNTDNRFGQGPVGFVAMSTAASPSAYMSAGTRPQLQLTGAFTIAAWAFPSLNSELGVIVGREGEYLIARFPDGTLRYSLATTTPGWGWVDTGHVLGRVWSHVALTYDGTAVRAYVNGRQVHEAPASGPIGDAAPGLNEFRVGARQDPSGLSHFTGGIDDLHVYGRALDAAEIERVFLAGTTGLCGPLNTTLDFQPNPVRVTFDSTSEIEIVARLSTSGAGGAPLPGRTITIFKHGTQIGSGVTDANGEVRLTASVFGVAAGTSPSAFRAEHAGDFYYAARTTFVPLITEKATPRITWAAPASIAYGTTLSAAQLTATADTGGTFVYSPAAGTVLAPGTHTLSVTFTPFITLNYDTATAEVTLEVTKATPTITLSAPPATYDGTSHGATATATGMGGSVLTPVTITYNGSTDAPVTAGTYDVVASFAGDANHEAASATATLTIAKASATVSATGGTFTYDGSAHPATGAATGVGGATLTPLTFTYNGSADAPVNAGTYAVVATFAGDANHEAGSATATLTIGKAATVVNWSTPAGIVYGTALGAGQLNATASTGGTFLYSPAAGTVPGAGTHTLSVTFTPADTTNYTGASASTTIAVSPALLTVRAVDAVKRFGAPLPALTAAMTGFVNGDSAALLSGTVVLNTAATQGSAVGAYPIVPSGVSSPNYTIAFVNGTLAVVRGSVQVAVVTSPEPSGFEGPMTFTASVAAAAPSAGSPSGTVRFFDGSTLIGIAPVTAGMATLSTAGFDAGIRTIEARYDGDGSFEPGAMSAPHVIRNESQTPALTVTSSRNPANTGQSVTFTATVSLASGLVEFYDGGALLGTSPISAGRATFTISTLAAGSHAITARYPGSASLPPARSAIFVQAVGASGWKNRASSIAIVAAPDPAVLGDSIVVTADVTGSSGTPAGRVLFIVDETVVADVDLAAVSGTTGRAVVTLPGLAHGRHGISATYLGSSNYKGSTNRVTVTVN